MNPDWTLISRIIITLGLFSATFFLASKKITTPGFTAILGGLALLWLIWNVDLQSASRIAGAGFEIERKVEVAQDTIRRLEALESSAKNTTDKLHEVTTKAEDAIQRLHKLESSASSLANQMNHLANQAEMTLAQILELSAKESQRYWAMILPSGQVAVAPDSNWIMGLPKEASIMTGKLLELHGKAFFEDPNRGWVWTCNDTDIASFTALIESFPQILYAYVARADCLKKHGIASWQEDASRAKKLCDITRAVDPHTYMIDNFCQILEGEILSSKN